MPTVWYFDCSACFTAQSWSCGSTDDLYSSVSPSSAACKCGSPVPAYQTSYFGLAFSAETCAIDSPEPFCVMPTLMPVSFVNCAAIASHQGIGTLQMRLSWPCACAAVAQSASTKAAMLPVQRSMSVLLVEVTRAT